MYGFKKGKAEAKTLKSGKIEGPGTATSDSIKADVPRGTYIMPADSTQQIGPEALASLGAQGFKPGTIDARVSNGEFGLPPAQVHAIGAQVLDQIKGATHSQGAARGRGARVSDDKTLYFADGGLADDDRRKGGAGTGPSPMNGAVARGEGRRIERMGGAGLYSQSNADLGDMATESFPNTATAMRGAGQNIIEAYQAGGIPTAGGAAVRNTLVPAIGFAADVGRSAKQVLDPFANAVKTAITGDPTPIPGTRPIAEAARVSPAVPGANSPESQQMTGAGRGDQRQGYVTAQDPQQGPALGMNVSATSVPEIHRVDGAPGLSTPMFTNLPTGEAVSGMQGGAVNTLSEPARPASADRAAAAGLELQQDGPRGGVIASPDRSDMKLSRGPSDAMLGWMMRTGNRRERDAAAGMLVGREKIEGEQRVAQLTADAAMQDRASTRALEYDRLAASAKDAQQRRGVDAQRLGIEQQRADSETRARGFEARGMERVERLYAAYESAKTPEERASVAEQIRAMSGKEAPNRFTVVPGGQEIDPTTNMAVTRPARVFNNQSGQFVDQPGGQAAPAVPRPNEVRNGYRFKGGNPADQANWEKV